MWISDFGFRISDVERASASCFMRPAITTIGVFVLFAGSASAQPEIGRPLAPPHTITVTGNGEAKASPDVAYVTVGVLTESRRAQDAAQANASATQKVLAALKQQGIAEKDLQTSNYSVQPQYEQNPGRSTQRIVGYQVSNQVRATVRKLGSVGNVIDAALDAGANNIYGVGFGLDARSGPESEALASAVTEARRKADVLARAAGVRITGVQQIQEGGFVRPVRMMEGAMAFGRAAAATPIQQGELTVSATVTVVYTLAPNERQARLETELPMLRVQRAHLAAELSEALTLYTETYPKVKNLRSNIAALDKQIASIR